MLGFDTAMGVNAMKYSIITAFNNNYALISNFVEHLLLNVDQQDGELILYSDGCKNSETLDYLRKRAIEVPWIKLFLSKEQKGYSIANNCAVRESTGQILVFMNSDVLPQKGSVEKLVEIVAATSTPCAAQGRLVFPQNMLIQSTGHLFCGCHNSHIYTGKRYNDPIVLQSGLRQALTTAFCAIPRSVFLSYNGFDERYYNAYEGMELTLKITQDGGKCLYCPDCMAYHITGSTRHAMQYDNEMPGRYFWSAWKARIISDLAVYLQPQITKQMQKQIYFHIECGSISEWPDVLKAIGIATSGNLKLEDRFVTTIDLYHNLPFSALCYAGPYLFTVNDIASLRGNYNWTTIRNNSDDLVLDGHGNVAYLVDLVGKQRQ